MTTRHTTLIALLGIALAAGGFFAGRRMASTPMASAAEAMASSNGKVLYWHDPMVPAQRFDKPGKSPFMDMQLVPVYAQDAGDTTGVTVSAAVQQNLGIRVVTVHRADLPFTFDALGTVQFDERLDVAVQTRVAGYVEHLAVRAPMERVRKGQALATVFAPEWLGPQNELLALKRSNVSPDLVAAARDRMRALSIPAELVRRSEEAGTAQARFTVTAPASGVVAELGIREGAAVTPGMTMFRIAGLEKVWAVAEIPEAQALRLSRGQKVAATLQADASQTFSGALQEILPEVNAATRTLKARFEVDNRAGKLTPGMLLSLQVAGPKTTSLVLPSEAVIRTGKRVMVMVRKDNGTFEPRAVSVGRDVGEETEILQGLSEGEQVVASGQFLIDSEASLRSVVGSMAVPASAPAMTPAVHVGEGKVESVTAEAVTISHGPITSLQWPSMTMGFGKPDPHAFADVKPGDRVRFEFKEGGPSGYALVKVQPVPAGAKP
ncbi:MAG: efflux RND transporter periplasmic adaptor subunit [Rhodoferax sp.]|uniref:efflux RND transporter periplasmic adaptor subunit n=1 Tax=Rhodoferax sp. TaxID=50421 RepID=UPI0032642417